MSLKLYYDLLSQPSRALYILLKTCNIPFEKRIISIGNLDHLSPEYEQLNPFKKVPCIEHNGFILTESIAIIRYLSREYDIDEQWYPSSSRDQARVDEYLEWQHLNTRMHCSAYFILKYMNPKIKGVPPDPEKLKVHKRRMDRCLDLIENIWLKNKPFLIGHEISVADILGACEIEQPRMAGYDPREGRPSLSAWMDRVAKETSPHYQEAHKFVNMIVDQEKKESMKSASKL